MLDKTKEGIKEDAADVKEEVLDTIQEKSAFIKAEDWFGEHNIFSRLIILAVIWAFGFTLYTGMDIAYFEFAGWILVLIFVIISVGINSIKTIGDVITKIRKGE